MNRVGILTVSDKGSRGERVDASGDMIRKMCVDAKFTVSIYCIVPDEMEQISKMLIEWSDGDEVDLILTTGGTGLSPRDVTPEATLAVIEKAVPGISEAMRAVSLNKTAHAMLTRSVAGIRKKSLIVNLPGSPKAVKECLEVILPALPHAIDTIKGQVSECATINDNSTTD